ncbi:hypothetical protein GOODEAATRI_028068, partial [Goodea atripinnis]
FSISINRIEDLQIKADEDKFTDVQVTYDFMRKDLLGKSLQVLTSSSVLLQRLRQLQRTEALQRRGRVLQDEEEVEESSQGSQFSRGPVLMLEELVEALQDRRRRADQAFRLQLQQAEVVLKMKAESKRASTEVGHKSRSQVSGSGSDPLSVKHQLDETKLGLNEQQTHHQMEAQQQQEHEMFSSGYQERLMKTLQDLNCVSELLVSCTQLDLGSELQTSRLLERFKEAEPHFKLDAEVEYTVKSWESLREDHTCLEEVKTGAVMNEDLLELLKIQQTVKDKIQRSELILNLSSSFHLTAKQNWAGFQVEQLEVRLGSLDSLCESWLSKAAQCEEELRREQLTHLLHEDITQMKLPPATLSWFFLHVTFVPFELLPLSHPGFPHPPPPPPPPVPATRSASGFNRFS